MQEKVFSICKVGWCARSRRKIAQLRIRYLTILLLILSWPGDLFVFSVLMIDDLQVEVERRYTVSLVQEERYLAGSSVV